MQVCAAADSHRRRLACFQRRCLLILLCLAVVVAAPAGALTRPAGDIAPLGNPDGRVDAADLLILQRLVLGGLDATPEQLLVADVAPLGNPDGELNAGDIVVLMRALAGQVTLSPVYLGPDAPRLDISAGTVATNPYTVSGSAAPGLEVRLYVDGQWQASTTAAPDSGNFSFSAILDDGANSISASAVDTGLEGPASDPVTLEYTNSVPREQSGVLADDTVWTAGAPVAPYVIGADLTVPAGVTLTVQPGAILKFANGATLFVDGTLDIRGRGSAPVHFTADAASPANGDWAGIRLNSGSSGSVIDYALIEYASPAVSVDGAPLRLEHSTIRNFGTAWGDRGVAFTNGASGAISANTIDNGIGGYESGIFIENASPEVSANSLRNTGTGVWVQAQGSAAASPHIRNNDIGSTRTAIFVDTASPWVDGNRLHDGSTGLELYGGARALINNQNIIVDNNSTGIQFVGDGFNNPDSIVSNNSIYNNRLNVYITGYTEPLATEVELGGNWWGSTSPSVISAAIFDHKDVWGTDAPPAKVVPFLDGPAGNPVSGNFLNGRVAADTMLAATTPYIVIGSYVVPLATSLHVPAGAVLKFASNAMLHARGQLSVQGEADNQSRFVAADDIAALAPWWGVLIGDKESRTNYNTGSVIANARFEDAFIATEVFAENLSISDSRYLNNFTALQLDGRSSGVVSNNLITGYKDTASGGTSGVKSSDSAQWLISKNIISGLVKGIVVHWKGAPLVKENNITANTYGIYIEESGSSSRVRPVINAGNSISGNDYGVFSWGVSAGSVSVNQNNIFSNLVNYYKANSSTTDDATNNWWNTTVEAEIAAGISAQSAGSVDYVPYLTGPVPVAPVINSGESLTRSASYPLSGLAQAGVQVRIFVNGSEQVVVAASADGTFSANVTLAEGDNRLYAEAFNASTTSSPSATLAVTLDSIAPVIGLTSPSAGAVVNAYPIFSGTLSEASTLTIDGQAVTVAADLSFSHGPVALAEGGSTVSLIAVDAAGNSGTLPVALTLDTTPPPDPDMSRVNIGAPSGGNVTVTGGVGAIEAGATVTLVNARSGELTTLTAAADGSFSAGIAALDGDLVSLVVSDELGNQAAWGQQQLNGPAAALAITAITPADGASIDGDRVTVSGTFEGPANTGIVVAGRSAAVQNGRFMVSDLPLEAGSNSLDITATTADGLSASRSLTLIGSGAPPFRVSVAPDHGVAPLAATLSIDNNTGEPIKQLGVDFNNDGQFEMEFSDLDYSRFYIGPLGFRAGHHQGTVLIIDSAGNGHTLPFELMVDELIGAEARIRAVYRRMVERLSNSDVTGALSAFSATSRSQYRSLFDALGTNLPAAVSELGEIRQAVIGTGWAELILVRTGAGSETAFKINFIQSEDGVWRIENM